LLGNIESIADAATMLMTPKTWANSSSAAQAAILRSVEGGKSAFEIGLEIFDVLKPDMETQ
jgi:hypothetical protein